MAKGLAWPVNPDLVRFTYERGEGRTKHKWAHDRAGFVETNGKQVGKCHSSIDEATAQDLLRSGIAPPSIYGDEPSTPDEIFNIYRGVPYVAVTTQPGKSYHGYPWAGRMSASMRGALEERARAEGTLREFKRWSKEYNVK